MCHENYNGKRRYGNGLASSVPLKRLLTLWTISKERSHKMCMNYSGYQRGRRAKQGWLTNTTSIHCFFGSNGIRRAKMAAVPFFPSF